MNKHLHPNKSRACLRKQGFTLIELLIVIAIIGILAAVLIAVINPVAQQNKARDGVITSTMNKIGLAVNSYSTTYATYPSCSDLAGDLNTATIGGITAGTPTTNCTITGGTGTGSVAGKYNATTGTISFPVQGTTIATDYWLWTPATSVSVKGATQAW